MPAAAAKRAGDSVRRLRSLIHALRRAPDAAAARLLESVAILLLASLSADAVLVAFANASAVPAALPAGMSDRATSPGPSRTALATLGRFDPFYRLSAGTRATGKIESGPLPGTDLDLKLYGIRADSAGKAGTAVIATPDGRQAVYRSGDRLLDGVRVGAIAADHVVLERNGTEEALWLSQRRRPPRPAAAPGAATRDADTPAFDLRAALAGIETSPLFRDGEFHGIVIEGPATATFLQRNSLIPGDIVLAVEGVPLASTASMAEIDALSGARSVTVEIERNGERRRVLLSSGE
ncbi:MAG: type II secretion system protein N [Rhodothalassiaceae bacterium]